MKPRESKPESDKPATKATRSKSGHAKPASGGFRIKSKPDSTGAESQEIPKFDLGAADAARSGAAAGGEFDNLGELPHSYGANLLYLVARDADWLFSYWDVDWSPFADQARGGRVFLRLLDADDQEVERVAINPYARNWYLPARSKGTTFSAELGFEDASGAWHAICSSGEAFVPSQEVSGDEADVFAHLPLHVSFQNLLDTVRFAMEAGETLIGALARLQREGAPELARFAPAWSADQMRILEALLGREIVERISLGSGMIDKVLQRQLIERLSSVVSSEVSARLGELAEFGPTSLASGFGASWSAQPFSKRGFFMHVNAEVIFYGGTDPGARVTIDGKEIKLEPDGSFRYHFKFPDGGYEIPIVAQSPDGLETRSATLSFKRGTERTGDVGHTSQPRHLGTPMGKK